MNDATTKDDDMQPEYDFSRAERGKHYAGPKAVFHVPVYLDQDVLEYLSRKAEEKGASLSQLVNEILKCDIALIESLK
jgi:hypothetical protein